MRTDTPVIKTILKGLAVLLPIMVIGIVVYWFVVTVEFWLAGLFRLVLPDRFYIPGMGFLTGVFLSYLVGLLMNTGGAQRMYDQFERALHRIPLVKSLYGAIQDIVQLFSKDPRKRYNRVVTVHFQQLGIRLVGFVTQEDANALPAGVSDSDSVAVYLPMSYQIGGYFLTLPKSMVEPLDLTIEDASRLVLTAGMSVKKRDTGPD